MKKSEVKFAAPAGFAPPEDTEPGKSFEVLATVKQTDDGMLELEALDGAAVGGEDPADKMDTSEDSPDFLGAIEKGMTS